MSKWKPKDPGLLSDDELLKKWIGYFRINRDKPCGIAEDEYEETAQGVARYWFYHRKHGPDYGNSTLRHLQQLWDAFIKLYELVEET
jgi:hypothetical protein